VTSVSYLMRWTEGWAEGGGDIILSIGTIQLVATLYSFYPNPHLGVLDRAEC
jgi:hypothetical protein